MKKYKTRTFITLFCKANIRYKDHYRIAIS